MSATVMLFAGGLMVFAALALTLSLVGVVTTERRGVARSLAAIQALDAAADVLRADVERPFAERVIGPLGERLVGVGRRLVRADTAERIQHRLDIAGNPAGWDVNRIIGLKVAGGRRPSARWRSSSPSPAVPRSPCWWSAPRGSEPSATSCPTSSSTTPDRSVRS